MIKVANPIYDVVFKYLMEDNTALANPEVREIMNIEDDIMEELSSKERRIDDLVQRKERG